MRVTTNAYYIEYLIRARSSLEETWTEEERTHRRLDQEWAYWARGNMTHICLMKSTCNVPFSWEGQEWVQLYVRSRVAESPPKASSAYLIDTVHSWTAWEMTGLWNTRNERGRSKRMGVWWRKEHKSKIGLLQSSWLLKMRSWESEKVQRGFITWPLFEPRVSSCQLRNSLI